MTKYLLATLFVWFGLHTIYAQTYYFDKYSVRDGLAQSKVMSSYQDKNGNLWLGTTSGVSSFDGRRFINYTMVDGLAEGGVQAIIADSLGNIWFGHTGGALSVKIGDKITAVELKGVKIHSDITDLLVDRYQNLWITTESNGVVRLSNLGQHLKKATHYTSKEGISDRVFKVTETSKGEIYFIIEGGIKLYDYDTNNFSFFTLEGLPKYFQITELMEDTKGNMWFGTYNGGLYCYEAAQKKIAIYDVRDGLAHNWITSLAEAEDGAIWVGTFGGGISRIRNKVIKTFNEQNGLADNKIRSVMPDREGNLVICTQEHGMLIFKGEQFVHYGANFQLNSQV
ncbi:MAG: hypothetical protein RIS47_1462, partial [Bacteroidota bacterium]